MNNSPRQNYRGNRFRGNTRGYNRQDYRNERYNNYNRDRNRLRERNFMRNYSNSRKKVQVIVDQGQGLEPVQIGIG